jgi:hypothetical protein
MRARLFAPLLAACAALALVPPYAANAAPDAGADSGADAAPDAVADAGSDGAGGVPAPVGAADLLTGFGSKEGCSCVFVDGQTDAYCTQFAQAPGYMSQVTIDHAGMSVSAMFFGVTRTAHFTAGAGCKLDPLP